VEEYGDEIERGIIYSNETEGLGIMVDFHFISGETLNEVLFEGNTQTEKVTVNGIEADYYFDDESSALVWIDKNDNVAFTISAQLSKEEITQIAESIIKK
jgi:hypothetical protein